MKSEPAFSHSAGRSPESARTGRTSRKRPLVVLAGQQNGGKSTLFNTLTGASQHIANYPGVTVDKKSGSYRHHQIRIDVVDLPGTYSLTSFSLEERVARDFIFTSHPDVVVNVVDAAGLKRSLLLTLQLLEAGFPMIMALNMIDVAHRRGLSIDVNRLEDRLGIRVIPTIGRKRQGKNALKKAIWQTTTGELEHQQFQMVYEKAEPLLARVEQELSRHPEITTGYPVRWMAVRLMEEDDQIEKRICELSKNGHLLLSELMSAKTAFETDQSLNISDYLASCREKTAARITRECVTKTRADRPTLTEKIDRVVLNRLLAPLFLLATVYLIYDLSIVRGYQLTQYTWPLLATLRNMVAGLLPDAGLLLDPYLRALSLWIIDSTLTLLNYIPIFFILFGLIAILEDSGYMARIAFIMDKLFYNYGLHGQSTLPFILGGVFAGGCAVPGVMAARAIPDERARMATILTVPFMNCMAKIPLYTLIVNIYFANYKSWAMLFISTITIIVALFAAKLLTTTVIRQMTTTPFVMALPAYHLPTVGAVLTRALERVWLYVKKVGTIVVVVAVIIFVLLQWPGINKQQMAGYQQQMQQATDTFCKMIETADPHLGRFTDSQLLDLLNDYDDYKRALFASGGGKGKRDVDRKFQSRNELFFSILKPEKDETARKISRALKKLHSKRKRLRREIKEARIVNSFLGMTGKILEPVSRFAGFDWKINVALLSSFAARESSVATLGVLFREGADANLTLEQRMDNEGRSTGFSSLNALALLLFFALYPPCLATAIMVKVQTQSYKWMLFSIIFPTVLGLIAAGLVYSIGSYLNATGIQMMGIFYGVALTTTILFGFIKTGNKLKKEKIE